MKRIAIAVVLVLLSAACTQLRGGGPGDEGLLVTVGVPGLGGDRVVTITAPSPPPSGSVNVSVWLDAMEGAPIAQGPTPLTFTFDGDTAPPGIHRIVATSRDDDGIRYGFGYFNTELRLNQVQVLGTHNSYHIAPNPSPVPEWEYSHDPLDVQLESQGIRQFELDVWADPNGHKVFHVPVLDANTNCSLFKTCLQVIKHWSNEHRNHMPIAIQVEIEDTPYTPDIKPFDAAAFDQLDEEIRSVFQPYRVFTPDDERGDSPTLADAVTKKGWPTINSLRGQVMFLMDNAGTYRDIYTAGRPNLEGRMIFTNSSIGRPDAAFIKLNDPVGDAQRIHDAVAAGYVVRTRADADTHEARDNNTVPRDAAINGGAQWVSTDFEVPGKAYGGPYFVSIPGGTPARCNPLNTPSWCTSSMIEPGG